MRNKEKIFMPKDRFTMITIDDTSMIPPELTPAQRKAMEKRLAKKTVTNKTD